MWPSRVSLPCSSSLQHSAAVLHPRAKHVCHNGWSCVLLTSWERGEGSLVKHMGSYQAVHALGCGRVMCWECVRVAFPKGWLGFWKAWKTQWQGYIEEEKGSCARKKRTCGGERDACDSTRTGEAKWSIPGVTLLVMKQPWEITELRLCPPRGKLSVLISTEQELYRHSTDSILLILCYWNIWRLKVICYWTAYTHTDAFFPNLRAYNIYGEMEWLLILTPPTPRPTEITPPAVWLAPSCRWKYNKHIFSWKWRSLKFLFCQAGFYTYTLERICPDGFFSKKLMLI